MRKVFVVATTEFGSAVRTRSFLLGIVMLPAMMVGSILIQVFANRADTRPRAFAVVDHTGTLYRTIAAAAEARNASAVLDKNGRVIAPRFEPSPVAGSGRTDDEVRLELSDRVRNGALYAFVEIPTGLDDPGAKVLYHSDNPNDDALRAWLGATIGAEVRNRRFAARGIAPSEVERLDRPVPAEDLGLFDRGPDGRITPAPRVDKIRTFAVPAVLMFIVFFIVTTCTPPLLYGVIEEKMSRISEVLLGSLRPFELMMGKLLCNVGVAMVMASCYVGGAYAAAWYYGYADAVPTWLFGALGLFLVLAVFLYGSFYMAVGAACSELKDAQSLTMPVMTLSMIPAFVWVPVVLYPSSALAVGLSLFPPATPCLMLLRLALHPSPPAWQVALSVALTLATALASVWAGGKVFRTGLLMQGKAPNFRELARWVLAR
jgi:ABC-2 type transport system permease protein